MNEMKQNKIGFTCGSFDLCHYGHVLMLEECKKKCSKLIVGVQEDPTIDRPNKNKPIQSLKERVGQVEAIKWVDEVIVYDTEANLLEYLKKNQEIIDIRFVGDDWRGKPFTGKSLPIEISYNKRDHGFSSSELRKRIENAKYETFAKQMFGIQRRVDELESVFFINILNLIEDPQSKISENPNDKSIQKYDDLVALKKIPEFWEFDYNEESLIFDQCPDDFKVSDLSASAIWQKMGFKHLIIYYKNINIPPNHIDCSSILQ